MKIIILDGSHNKSGYTQKLINAFIDGIKSVKPKSEIKIYDLLNEKISFCLGCGKCTEDKDPVNAKCTINDTANQIKNEALEADVVVFATPIYEFAVSSAMKRFLERCLTLVTFKMGPTARGSTIKGKWGIALCPFGAPWPFGDLMGITSYPKKMLPLACKLFRCDKIEMILAGGMPINEKFKNKYLDKTKKLGIKVANSK